MALTTHDAKQSDVPYKQLTDHAVIERYNKFIKSYSPEEITALEKEFKREMLELFMLRETHWLYYGWNYFANYISNGLNVLWGKYALEYAKKGADEVTNFIIPGMKMPDKVASVAGTSLVALSIGFWIGLFDAPKKAFESVCEYGTRKSVANRLKEWFSLLNDDSRAAAEEAIEFIVTRGVLLPVNANGGIPVAVGMQAWLSGLPLPLVLLVAYSCAYFSGVKFYGNVTDKDVYKYVDFMKNKDGLSWTIPGLLQGDRMLNRVKTIIEGGFAMYVHSWVQYKTNAQRAVEFIPGYWLDPNAMATLTTLQCGYYWQSAYNDYNGSYNQMIQIVKQRRQHEISQYIAEAARACNVPVEDITELATTQFVSNEIDQRKATVASELTWRGVLRHDNIVGGNMALWMICGALIGYNQIRPMMAEYMDADLAAYIFTPLTSLSLTMLDYLFERARVIEDIALQIMKDEPEVFLVDEEKAAASDEKMDHTASHVVPASTVQPINIPTGVKIATVLCVVGNSLASITANSGMMESAEGMEAAIMMFLIINKEFRAGAYFYDIAAQSVNSTWVSLRNKVRGWCDSKEPSVTEVSGTMFHHRAALTSLDRTVPLLAAATKSPSSP